MKLSWRLQRQIIIFTIYFLMIFIPFSIVTFLLLRKSPSCFDQIQNQDEEGVDCGGMCNLKCDGTYRNIKVNFTRGMKVTDGKYDIFALLENFNQFVDFPYVPYEMKFYNFEGKLMGSATGSLAIDAQTKGVVYFPNLSLAQDPKTIELNLSPYKGTKAMNLNPKTLISVENWQSTRGANDSLQVVGELKNPYNDEVFDLNVYALLYDDTKTVYAVSTTKVVSIKGREKQAVVFTWGNLPDPANVEFVVIINHK